MAAQVQDPSLQDLEFYVADGVLYSMEGGPTLWLTREPENLVLRHLDDRVNSSYDQLQTFPYNFHPSPDEVRQAMQAKDTLRIDLTRLRFSPGADPVWRHVEINTTSYDKLNAEERKLAERFYGEGEAFKTAMRTLEEVGIVATGVYVFNPAHVQKKTLIGPIGVAADRNPFHAEYKKDAISNIGVVFIKEQSTLCGIRRISAPQHSERLEESPHPTSHTPLTMEEVLAYSTPFVPKAKREDFAEGLQKLYTK